MDSTAVCHSSGEPVFQLTFVDEIYSDSLPMNLSVKEEKTTNLTVKTLAATAAASLERASIGCQNGITGCFIDATMTAEENDPANDIVAAKDDDPANGITAAKSSELANSITVSKDSLPTNGIVANKDDEPANGSTAPKSSELANSITLTKDSLPTNGIMTAKDSKPAAKDKIPANGVTVAKDKIPANGVTVAKDKIPADGVTVVKDKIPANGVTAAKDNGPANGVTAAKDKVPANGIVAAKNGKQTNSIRERTWGMSDDKAIDSEKGGGGQVKLVARDDKTAVAPDGGLMAWAIVAASFMMAFLQVWRHSFKFLLLNKMFLNKMYVLKPTRYGLINHIDIKAKCCHLKN